MGRAGQKCQRINALGGIPQPMTDGELVDKYPSFLPLRVEGTTLSKFYTVSQWSPGGWNPSKLIPVTCSVAHPALAAFTSLSHSSTRPPPPQVLPRITSQINCLALNPCLRVCFWGQNPT